jgi:co-chaperonin GroES (HSP10)
LIRVLSDRVLVEPVENDEINPGGVVYVGLPETTFTTEVGKVKQVCSGKVISVGPGKRNPKTGKRRAPEVGIGDYVAFSDTCHRPFGEKDYIVIREQDIVGISKQPIGHVSVNY